MLFSSNGRNIFVKKQPHQKNIFPHKSSDATDVISKYSIHLMGNLLRLGAVTFPPVSREKDCVVAIAVEKSPTCDFFLVSVLPSQPSLIFFLLSQIKRVGDGADLSPSCESFCPHLAQKSRTTTADKTCPLI